MFTYTYIYMYIYVYIYICEYVFMYVCMYYTYVCTHAHTHTHTHKAVFIVESSPRQDDELAPTTAGNKRERDREAPTTAANNRSHPPQKISPDAARWCALNRSGTGGGEGGGEGGEGGSPPRQLSTLALSAGGGHNTDRGGVKGGLGITFLQRGGIA